MHRQREDLDKRLGALQATKVDRASCALMILLLDQAIPVSPLLWRMRMNIRSHGALIWNVAMPHYSPAPTADAAFTGAVLDLHLRNRPMDV